MLQIKVLEAELKKQDAQDNTMTNREEVKHPESYLQLVIQDFILKIIVFLFVYSVEQTAPFLSAASCKCSLSSLMYSSTSGTAARRGSLSWRPV